MNLSALLCSLKIVFAHGDWTAEECDDRAALLEKLGLHYKLDPLLLVAVNIQECDLREGMGLAWTRNGLRGVDACPMGVRVRYPAKVPSVDALYEKSAQMLARMRARCKARGHKHHFLYHYNPGNPLYVAQVMAILSALRGDANLTDVGLTSRTLKIVRAIHKVHRKGCSDDAS